MLEIYEDTTPIAIALDLAERGWKVFPCRVWWSEEQDKYLKEPLKARGFSWKIHGSSDPDAIKAWPWAGMNAVGVCGFATVLDQDDGAKEPLPLGTLCQRTISGGYHHFFMPDPSITNAEKVWQDLPDQCNVRGVSNGWVVWYDSLIDPDAAIAYWPYNRKPEPERERKPQGPGNDSPITKHPEYVRLLEKDYPSRSERDCAVAGLMFSEGYTLSQFRSAITQIGPDLSSACDPANDFERQTTRLWDYVSWEEVAKPQAETGRLVSMLTTCNDYLDIKKPEWLLKGILHRGRGMGIAGQAGAGKTLLACAMIRRAIDNKLLEADRVLWVNGDLDAIDLKSIVMANLPGLPISYLHLADEDWFEGLQAYRPDMDTLAERFDLIVQDHRGELWPMENAADENCWIEYNNTIAAATARGCSTIALNHTAKDAENNSSGYGSQAQQRKKQTIIVINRMTAWQAGREPWKSAFDPEHHQYTDLACMHWAKTRGQKAKADRAYFIYPDAKGLLHFRNPIGRADILEEIERE